MSCSCRRSRIVCGDSRCRLWLGTLCLSVSFYSGLSLMEIPRVLKSLWQLVTKTLSLPKEIVATRGMALPRRSPWAPFLTPSWCMWLRTCTDCRTSFQSSWKQLSPKSKSLASRIFLLSQEVPTTAFSYVDSALQPFYQLQTEHKNKLKQEVIQHWLESALSESTHKYYETVSDVLSSVKKMEESLKRLKQARKNTPTNRASSGGGGMSDDDKIRLQFALDVGYLGEQIQKMGLQTKDVRSFQALAELVVTARDQAAAEHP